MRSPDRPEAAALRADASSAGERRALAARLLRLPDGHPSSLRGDGAEGDWSPDAADEEPRPPEQAEVDEDAAGERDPDEPGDQDEPRGQDEPTGPDEPGVDGPGADGPGAPEAARRAVGRPASGGTGAGRESYRPWFVDGEPGDPWFTADL